MKANLLLEGGCLPPSLLECVLEPVLGCVFRLSDPLSECVFSESSLCLGTVCRTLCWSMYLSLCFGALCQRECFFFLGGGGGEGVGGCKSQFLGVKLSSFGCKSLWFATVKLSSFGSKACFFEENWTFFEQKFWLWSANFWLQEQIVCCCMPADFLFWC